MTYEELISGGSPTPVPTTSQPGDANGGCWLNRPAMLGDPAQRRLVRTASQAERIVAYGGYAK